ncbi:hypothetical protein DFH07DRAFT_828716 [Mycena maculata]|uniref:Uncharacterized protein n=1 Tax=Mycena maculata TaxID=230809 RepID=A0AAD7ISF9_9AGAR|nr:hypothetical protein DFH07DRAFT_828716 [Mycena maculata]
MVIKLGTHTFVQQAQGAMPLELDDFKPKAARPFMKADDYATLTPLKATEALHLRLRVPWLREWLKREGMAGDKAGEGESEGEAGYWVEIRLFGGLFFVKGKTACLQVSATESYPLTPAMLLAARNQIGFNFVETYPLDFSPNAISPSPSTSRLERNKYGVANATNESVCCLGASFNVHPEAPPLSAEELARLVALAKVTRLGQ